MSPTVDALAEERGRILTSINVLRSGADTEERDIGDLIEALDGLTDAEAAPLMARLNAILADAAVLRLRKIETMLAEMGVSIGADHSIEAA